MYHNLTAALEKDKGMAMKMQVQSQLTPEGYKSNACGLVRSIMNLFRKAMSEGLFVQNFPCTCGSISEAQTSKPPTPSDPSSLDSKPQGWKTDILRAVAADKALPPGFGPQPLGCVCQRCVDELPACSISPMGFFWLYKTQEDIEHMTFIKVLRGV